MLVRGMSCHKIHKNFHSFFMYFLNKTHQLGICSITLVHRIEICHIIPTIKELGGKHRTNPNRVHSNGLDIVQLRFNSFQITDTVTITIFERGRINLINHRLFQPLRKMLSFHHSANEEQANKYNPFHNFHYFHFFILCPIAVALRKTLHPTVKYRLIEAERGTLRYIIPGLKHHLYHITKLYT